MDRYPDEREGEPANEVIFPDLKASCTGFEDVDFIVPFPGDVLVSCTRNDLAFALTTNVLFSSLAYLATVKIRGVLVIVDANAR